MKEVTKSLVLEDVQLIFRNFQGKEGMYNREGDRSFSVLLDPKLGHELEEEGWNVKWLKPREDQEEPNAHLEVAVKFNKGKPPRIVQVTSRGKTQLPEDLVEVLDTAEIEKADVIINPYHWNVNGNAGLKAYCGAVFATIRENELDLKYADLDEVR